MSTRPVALVIGASRGIGRQVAIDLAKEGYTVVLASKSTSNAYDPNLPFPPDPNSAQSTISTVEREIRELGERQGEALAIAADTRKPEQITSLFRQIDQKFGRLDVLVYNSGAIWWSSVEDTPFKRFKLMQEVNVEGLYASVQEALKLFGKKKTDGGNDEWKGRIVVVSPPIYSRFFRGKTAYAMGKVGMSVLTKGLAVDFIRQERKDMAITSIWPASAIQSAATENTGRSDPASLRNLRKPTIFSDAIIAILKSPTSVVNGLLTLDEDFLRDQYGVTDFSKYSVVPGTAPRRIMPAEFPVLEVAEQDDEGQRMDSTKFRKSKM